MPLQDVEQWMEAATALGMKEICLTAKCSWLRLYFIFWPLSLDAQCARLRSSMRGRLGNHCVSQGPDWPASGLGIIYEGKLCDASARRGGPVRGPRKGGGGGHAVGIAIPCRTGGGEDMGPLHGMSGGIG